METMLSAVEHALLKWKMQSSVVEHEASQVIYRCGFVLSWFDMKMPKSLNLVLAGNKKSMVARGYHKKVNDVCPSSSMTLNAHESWKVWILDFAFFCICVTGFYMHLFYHSDAFLTVCNTGNVTEAYCHKCFFVPVGK